MANLRGCLPEDAETLQYTTFTVKRNIYSGDGNDLEAFISLLERMMPEDSIKISYLTEDYSTGVQEVEVRCWLSDSEWELVTELNSAMKSEKLKKDPEEATDDGVD